MRENNVVCLPALKFCFVASMEQGSKAPLWLVTGLLGLVCLQPASAVIPADISIQPPQTGDHALHVLSPNLLELVLVNTKQPDPGRVNSWDWVNEQQNFTPPSLSSVQVLLNG